MNNNYITVTEVNKYIKEIVNEDLLLKKVYLKGEISNFKAHSRGHYYFPLKKYFLLELKRLLRLNSKLFC